jgi:hypothetical protein
MDRISPEDALAADIPPSEQFDVAPHFTPDESADGSRAVREMLKGYKAIVDQQHLAWGDEDRDSLRSPHGFRIAKDKRVKLSGFDGRLPYKGPYLNYWIQNRKIFRGRIKVVTLAEVPETAKDRAGEVVELRKLISFALQVSDQEILAADPLRCKVCVDFRARTEIELMAHWRRKHPQELEQLVAGIEAIQANEAEDEDEPPPPKPAPGKKRQVFRASAT